VRPPAKSSAPTAVAAAEALAIAQAQALVRSGLRRCRRRVRGLLGQGALPGGDGSLDAAVDRALRDLELLRDMEHDLMLAARRDGAARTAALADLAAVAPLAPLQRRVLAARLAGCSWPRIATACTRGDAGTAVRAYRQALEWLRCAALVQAARAREPGATAAQLAAGLGIGIRRVRAVLRRLAPAAGAAPRRTPAVAADRLLPAGGGN
jgi:hypothetical protein